jgi:hypothetical protein
MGGTVVKQPLLGLAVVALLLATSSGAWALTESLNQPRIFFRKDAEKTHIDALHDVVQDKKFAFRSGAISYWEPHFYTTLVYDGDTLALDRFLTALAKVPNARVKITLSPDLAKELRSMPSGAWSLRYSHQTPNEPEVRINLADGRIDVAKLLEKWLAERGGVQAK